MPNTNRGIAASVPNRQCPTDTRGDGQGGKVRVASVTTKVSLRGLPFRKRACSIWPGTGISGCIERLPIANAHRSHLGPGGQARNGRQHHSRFQRLDHPVSPIYRIGQYLHPILLIAFAVWRTLSRPGPSISLGHEMPSSLPGPLRRVYFATTRATTALSVATTEIKTTRPDKWGQKITHGIAT